MMQKSQGVKRVYRAVQTMCAQGVAGRGSYAAEAPASTAPAPATISSASAVRSAHIVVLRMQANLACRCLALH